MERVEALCTFGPEVARVIVADPPGERCLRFRVAGIIVALQPRHDVERMIGGYIGVDDAVPKAPDGLCGEHGRIRVHDPVDRSVADRVRTYRNSRLVEQADLRAIELRIERRVAAIACVDLNALSVPVVVYPGSARSTAAVHEHFDSAGHQIAAGSRRRRLWKYSESPHQRLCRGAVRFDVPEYADMGGQLALRSQCRIRLPFGQTDPRVLDRRHALAAHEREAGEDPRAALLGGPWRNESQHGAHCRFLEDTGRPSRAIAIDGARRRCHAVGRNARELKGEAVRNAVVPGRVHEPDGIRRRHGIEVAGLDVPTLHELALVPAAAPQPFTGLQLRDACRDAPRDLPNALGIAQLYGIQLARAALEDVRVRVHEPGSSRPAVQIDHRGAPLGERANLAVGADCDDAPVAHR